MTTLSDSKSNRPAKKASTKSRPAKRTRLRYGIIGAGAIAGTHMRPINKFEDTELIAAADVDPGRLDKARNEFGVQQVFTDWKQMLDECELDAVSVCTPNYLHYQPTLDALDAGCHVFVEKPLAMNAAEAREMVEKAKHVGRELHIAFQWRFDKATQFIRRAIDAGRLGDIMYARVHAMRRRGIPNWGVFGRKELQGGGPMIDIGVHVMEMAHYAMGRPRPVSASGQIWTYMGNKPSKVESRWAGWDHKTYTVEDLAVGLVKFDNGAVMHVEAMFAGHIGPDQEGMKFELVGTEGGARNNPPELYYDRDGTMVNVTPQYLGDTDFFEIKMRRFVDTCLYGKPAAAPGEDGLMIQQMIDAIYQSAQTGREVQIT
jgi:predicted dehydrogenase